MKNEIRNRLKTYKEVKADIVDIELKLEELEEEVIGITALPQGEKLSATYKITSSVENQVEEFIAKKEKLMRLKAKKEREIYRINNALEILTDQERDIIEMVLINQKRYNLIEIKYGVCYSRVKQIETKALRKIEKYLI